MSLAGCQVSHTPCPTHAAKQISSSIVELNLIHCLCPPLLALSLDAGDSFCTLLRYIQRYVGVRRHPCQIKLHTLIS